MADSHLREGNESGKVRVRHARHCRGLAWLLHACFIPSNHPFGARGPRMRTATKCRTFSDAQEMSCKRMSHSVLRHTGKNYMPFGKLHAIPQLSMLFTTMCKGDKNRMHKQRGM